jgi:hypothetical protein
MSTPGSITILTSNPTRRSGFFYRTQTEWSDKWRIRKISCFDSKLVDPAFIKEVRERYGVDSAVYAVRVLGEFPPAESDTLIAYHLVQAAINRDVALTESEPIYWGLDVARFGVDDSALAKRQGNTLLEPIIVYKSMDLMELVGRVKAEYDALQNPDQPTYIFVDSIGLGAGVADRLRELKLPAIDVNVSEKPSLEGPHGSLRDELWFKVKAWFTGRNCTIPANSDRLVSELSTVKMMYASNGKLKAESKDQMRKRGLPSPDLADALCMTFAFDGAAAGGQTHSSWDVSCNKDMDQSWLLKAS